MDSEYSMRRKYRGAQPVLPIVESLVCQAQAASGRNPGRAQGLRRTHEYLQDEHYGT